eukprot:3810463-Alexandrium_andersonii.AAC.1
MPTTVAGGNGRLQAQRPETALDMRGSLSRTRMPIAASLGLRKRLANSGGPPIGPAELGGQHLADFA